MIRKKTTIQHSVPSAGNQTTYLDLGMQLEESYFFKCLLVCFAEQFICFVSVSNELICS